MPDGKIGRFEVPEGTTPEAAQAQIQAQFGGQQEEMMPPDSPQPQEMDREQLHQRQMSAESGGDQAAVSPKGATGRMQVMPRTGPEAAALAGLPWDETRFKTDGAYNEALGRAYMDHQQKVFGDNRLALAAYNAGPGRVQQLLGSIGDPRRGEVSWEQFQSHLPGETQGYVSKILGERNPEVPEAVKEGGRIAASAIKGGLGAYPEMLSKGLSSVSDWGSYAADKLGVPSIPGLRDLPAPTDLLKEGVDYLFKPRDYEVPQTDEGKGAARIGSSVVAGVMAPGSILQNAAAGFTSGVGAEIGQQVGGTPGAVIGGIAGGLAPATAAKAGQFFGSPLKTQEKLASMGLENVKPEDLIVAQKTMEDARKLGVNLTLEQALPTQTNIRELQNKLTQMGAGEPLAAQLRNQPNEIQAASEKAVAGLPGQVKGQQEIANQSQQAADVALKNLRQERTAAVAPAYAQAGSIQPEDALSITSGIRDAVRGKGTLDRSKTLTKLYNKLNPMKTVTDASGNEVKKRIPVTDVQTIDDTLRELEKKMSNKPKDPRAQALIQSEIGKIRDQLKDLSPGYAQGSEQYAQITKDVINPAKQGPLGQIAQKTGYDPSNPASRTNLYGMFDRGEGVLTLQKDMAKAGKQGNQAFTDAGTSWFADKVQGAAKLEGGQLTGDLASNIEQGLYGSPTQVKRTNEVLAGIARAQGVEESTFVNGMKTWAQTIAAAAKLPSSMKGLSSREIEEASKSLFGRAANISVITPFRGTARKIDEMINKNAYSSIAKLMQTPEGIDTLRKLAASKPGSVAAQSLISKFNATMAAATQADDEE